jgi:hypothetical protein
MTACSGGSNQNELPTPDVTVEPPAQFEMRADSVFLQLVDGRIPSSVGKLDLQLSGVAEREQDLILGGEIDILLIVDPLDTFTTIYSTLEPMDGGAQLEQYFRADVQGAANFEDLTIASPANLDQSIPYVLNVAVGAADGRISETRTHVMSAVAPGTTDLTITLTWSSPTDLDLRLIEPSATHPEVGNWIDALHGNTSSSGAGFVGRPTRWDSNSGCTIDNRNHESIIYEAVRPPSGNYVVLVVYRNDCGTGPENFIVTIENDGMVETYTGTVGQQGDEVEVATFRRE